VYALYAFGGDVLALEMTHEKNALLFKCGWLLKEPLVEVSSVKNFLCLWLPRNCTLSTEVLHQCLPHTSGGSRIFL